jgi:hypothetical protein
MPNLFNARYDVPVLLNGTVYATRQFSLQRDRGRDFYTLSEIRSTWAIDLAADAVHRDGMSLIRYAIETRIEQTMLIGCHIDHGYTLEPIDEPLDESSPTFVRLNTTYTYAGGCCSPIHFGRIAEAANQAAERAIEGYRIPSLDCCGEDRVTMRDRNPCQEVASPRESAMWSSLIDPPAIARPNAVGSCNSRPRSTGKRRSYLTLMPFGNYAKCAEHFLDRDLKLMRVAALRTFKALQRPASRHPRRAVELWRGFAQSLVRYGIAIAVECRTRGIADTSLEYWQSKIMVDQPVKPAWVHWGALNKSHQSYLLLREERRIGVKTLHRYLRRTRPDQGLAEFCQHTLYIEPKRVWTMQELRIINDFVSSPDRIRTANRYAANYWWENPCETLRYPKDNVCSE